MGIEDYSSLYNWAQSTLSYYQTTDTMALELIDKKNAPTYIF